MSRLLRTFAAVCISLITAATAQGAGQLFFEAKVEALQSIAGTDEGPFVPHLRWGLVDGELPQDLVSFSVLRGPLAGPLAEIATLPVTPMDAGGITALYGPADQSRRLAALQGWLSEEDPAFVPGSYASVVAERLDPVTGNVAWQEVGARMDFNIARAMHRAYRDDTTLNATVQYELVGVFADQSRIRLGHVVIDPASPHVVPEPADFAQATLGRCDAASRQKDDAAVVLNWDHPGDKLDYMRNSIVVSGYDVYCSQAPAPVDAGLDLRALASALPHDAEGRVSFPGLQALNGRPIAISGSAETLDTQVGWNEEYAQLLLTAEQTQALGMEPGETYACYAAAYDITGNYGETARAAVTVPDLSTPPAPWSVEVMTDTPGDEVRLVFDHVNAVNYHRDHQDGRVYCNLDSAAADGELLFVGPGETCDEGIPRRLSMQVDRYRIYRFDDYNQARLFQDADGDAFPNRIEQELASTDPPQPAAGAGQQVCDAIPDGQNCYTLPGTACDPALPGGAPPVVMFDFVPAAHTVVRPSGRQVIEFADATPATIPGDIYWYRVSAESDRKIGPLSAPIRALFPDRRRPDRDDFLSCKLSFGEERCDTQAEVFAASQTVPFIHDLTDEELAKWARVSCRDSGDELQLDRLLEIDPTTRTADFSDDDCSELGDLCGGGTATVQYLAPDSTILAAVDLPPTRCDQNRTRLVGGCFESTSTAAVPSGQRPSGPVRLRCESPDYCVKIYREIGGEDVRLATVCQEEMPICFDGFAIDDDGVMETAVCDPGETSVGLPNLGGEDICLSAALVNENNISSSKLHLPCFKTAAPRPGIPSPIDIAFPGAPHEAELIWLPPEAPVTGTLLEVSVRGWDYQERTFIEHTGASANDGPQMALISLGAEAPVPVGDEEQEWCFRARSVGAAEPAQQDRALSDWSAERCATRTPSGVETPEYLGWPQLTPLSEGEAFEARYLGEDEIPVVRLGEGSACFNVSFGESAFPNGLDAPIPFGSHCPGDSCSQVANELAPVLSFVPYRQERSAPAEPGSEFVQVGPLVDTMHCGSTGALEDPLVKVARFGVGDDWQGHNTLFVDRFPHVPGKSYRYEFVYMSQGEVVGYRRTNWMEVP